MRPSSSPSDRAAPGLFDGVLAAGEVRAAVADAAWVRAMLDAEAALARAAARCGIATAEDASAVTAACASLEVDPGELGAEATGTGNPVVPLIGRLRAAVPEHVAPLVHRGATSQDIVDTAAMLVAQRALVPLLGDLAAVTELTAALADRHRGTVVAGRTLLQQALPTTFGLVAAGWLTGLDSARRRLVEVRDHRLAAQLGGAAGTLAAFRPGDPPAGRTGEAAHRGDAGQPALAGEVRGGADAGDVGVCMLGAFSAEAGLAEPDLPWHTERTRVADLAGALGTAAGAIAKVARDLVLFAQTEVGEVAEAGDGGGSSTLPHKHNPIAAISAAAAAAQAPGLVATLLAAMAHEHQRAAGDWHAEWQPLRALLASTGSAAHQLRRALTGLRVDAGRMRANLDLTHGALLAERVAGALRPALGTGAHAVVRAAVARGDLGTDPAITAHLDPAHLAELLTPETYLGSTDALIDRALTAARR
ncbi:lyase family protein [Actinoplanes auranticolor]|uniref:3-carboxy-cis,cis-muconate cycloisomerase n=1 Tax=Actinoplanes auranticolor TaxID=47988 RepID=A0A919VJ37_9ACTN|nr:lyase family protein [Actinoplanes auranticolor]GIM67852.1 3-carboxy-cis,cis-muconate cycloisomerase [Actinoplanes auranticolor]